jgi:hypothetical protein
LIHKRTDSTSNWDFVHTGSKWNKKLLITRCTHIDSEKSIPISTCCSLYFLISTLQERINILASISGQLKYFHTLSINNCVVALHKLSLQLKRTAIPFLIKFFITSPAIRAYCKMLLASVSRVSLIRSFEETLRIITLFFQW